MLYAKFQIVLGLFATAAACVLILARVGHYFGVMSATAAAVSLWIVLTACLQAWLLEDGDGWRVLLGISVFTSIPLFIVALPMLLSANRTWLQGRTIAGLAGAVVYLSLMWFDFSKRHFAVEHCRIEH